MKKSRFTDSQIIAVLKRAEAGTPVPELCRELDILRFHTAALGAPGVEAQPG